MSRADKSLDFDRAIALADRTVTPRFVVANVNSWNYSKTAVVHVHDPSEQGRAPSSSLEVRPSTSHGILNRPKRQSFSRPLTSDGSRRNEDIPPPPRLPPAFAPRHDSFDVPGPIGVAITSPLMPAADIVSAEDRAPPPPAKTATSSSSIKAPASTKEQQPAKTNRWKTMGSLFRRKTPATPAAPPPVPEAVKKTKQSPESSDSGRSSTSRRRSLSRRLSFGSISRSKVRLDETPPLPLPKIEVERAKSRAGSIRPGTGSNESNDVARPPVSLLAPTTTPVTAPAPMLNIEIPQVKMDRYSVMFSDLLSKSTTNVATTDKPERVISPSNDFDLFRPRTADPAPPAPVSLEESSLLHERRKMKMEKLSPLNMHRISSSPKFHQAPYDLKTAPLTRPTDNLPPLSAPPAPPKSAPLDRSPSVQQSYSLFPKTSDSSPQIPEIASFSPELNLFDEDEEAQAAPGQDPQDTSSLRALPQDARPLRSSSLLPSESDTSENLYLKRISAQPVLFPPSPPVSSKESPSTGTIPTTASASFRSSRYSRGSSLASSAVLNDESDFPSGIEINVEHADRQHADYNDYGLASPTFYEKSNASAEEGLDGQEMLSRSPSASSAIGDSPLLGMNRNVSLSYKHERPRFLKSYSDPQDEEEESRQSKDTLSEGRASARTPTFVHVDDLGVFEDEDAWIRRRSMWGIMDDGAE